MTCAHWSPTSTSKRDWVELCINLRLIIRDIFAFLLFSCRSLEKIGPAKDNGPDEVHLWMKMWTDGKGGDGATGAWLSILGFGANKGNENRVFSNWHYVECLEFTYYIIHRNTCACAKLISISRAEIIGERCKCDDRQNRKWSHFTRSEINFAAFTAPTKKNHDEKVEEEERKIIRVRLSRRYIFEQW